MLRAARLAAFLWFATGGASAQPGLYQFSIDQDALAGAPDFSYLNRPLTEADRLFEIGRAHV